MLLEEKIERPLFDASPFTRTVGGMPSRAFPETVSSAATLPGAARATIEVVVKIARRTQAETALRTQN
jgi:hypothetical protein